MSKNDYAIEPTFRIDPGLTHADVSNGIDRVMASVGFDFYDSVRAVLPLSTPPNQLSVAHHEELRKKLSSAAIPIASHGWPIKSVSWWNKREMIDGCFHLFAIC